MLRCLETDKICSEQNRKCKNCKLDSCKETIKLIEDQEKDIQEKLLKKLYKDLPEQCRHCSFLEVIDLRHQKVRCFYLIKNECLKGAVKCQENGLSKVLKTT